MKIEVRMKKLFIGMFSVIIAGGGVFAVNGEGTAGEIALPGVTTVVGGDSAAAGKEIVPDFAEIAAKPEKTSEIKPVPPRSGENDTDSPETNPAAIEKSVYAEGKAGGGFPLLFFGDFVAYRLSGNDPFTIRFSHESADGYCGRNFISGYNDRDTVVAVDRTFTNNGFEINAGGKFHSIGNGFQDLVENISNYNQNLLNGYANISYDFKSGFYCGTLLNLDCYTRYIDFTSNNKTASTAADWVARESVISFSPLINTGWKGRGFDIFLSGQYWLDWDTEGSLSNDKNPFGINNGRENNRGQFKLGLSWENDLVRFYGNSAIVFGTKLNGHNIIAPFRMGLEGRFPVYYANRKVAFHLEGGLDSYRNSLSELEKRYKFTGFSYIPEESSDWFGVFDFSLPIGSTFVISAGAEYRQTAFNNGIYNPVYEDKYYCNGLYGYKNGERKSLVSNVDFTFYINQIISISAGWKAKWMDLQALENHHVIFAGIHVQSIEAKWGASVKGAVAVDAFDKTPFVDLEVFTRITNSLQIVMNCEDLVKLCGNEVRLYGGHYIERSGTASMSLKFFF